MIRKTGDRRKKLEFRIEKLEKKMARIEALLIYVAGVLSIQFGTEILPFLSHLGA